MINKNSLRFGLYFFLDDEPTRFVSFYSNPFLPNCENDEGELQFENGRSVKTKEYPLRLKGIRISFQFVLDYMPLCGRICEDSKIVEKGTANSIDDEVFYFERCREKGEKKKSEGLRYVHEFQLFFENENKVYSF